MKFGVCSKGGVTPLLLISLGRFHMVLEHRTNLWTNDEMGEIEGSRKKGEEHVFWPRRKAEQKVREHSTGSTLQSTTLASANSQH